MFAQSNGERKLTQDASNPSPQELELLVQQRTAALRSPPARLLRVQHEERRRLARELHDGTGPLTALKIQLANLQKYLAGARRLQRPLPKLMHWQVRRSRKFERPHTCCIHHCWRKRVFALPPGGTSMVLSSAAIFKYGCISHQSKDYPDRSR
jgi:hypothetical protein